MTAAVVDPQTGEMVTMEDLNTRIFRTGDELERSTKELDARLKELGSVTYQFDRLYNATLSISDAKSEDRRKAEAFAACDLALLPHGESLARARARLETQVRAHRDSQHNLRALLSGFQTLSANLRAEIGLGGRLP